MLTFKEFLNKNDWFINKFGQSPIDEDFKSATPFQAEIPKSGEKINIFYERVYNFNIITYLRSFQNNQAKQYFPGPTYLRSLIYSDGDSFLVFVFKGGTLHKDVAEILSGGKVKLPKIDYLGIYTKAYRENNIINEHWCLPCYIENGKIGVYLDKSYLKQLEPLDAQKKLGLTDAGWKELLKNSGKA